MDQTITTTTTTLPPIPTDTITWIQKVDNDFTALGKAGKAGKWGIFSLIVIAALSAVTANPVLFAAWHGGALIVAANILLVFFKNLANPNVPNI